MAKAVNRTKTPAAKKTAGKKAPVADTREGLIAKMGIVLDEVDKVLPTMKEINWSWPKGKLLKLREQSDALITRMIKLIAPRDDMTPQKIFEAALAPAAGAVPSVARPGCFVEWVGYVPVLCCWSGFMFRAIDIRMADPAEKWLNETGYQSMQQPYIYPEELDVRTMFRSRLEQMVQNQGFALRDVSSFGRDQAVSRLAANEWLRALLDKGPVDPIAMPASMMAVQQSLFT